MKAWKMSEMWNLSSIALSIPSSIAVGMFFGYWLDKWLGTKPWMIILFTLLGVASGLMTFIRRVVKANREDERSAEAETRTGAGSEADRGRRPDNGEPEG
jgi:ATP synthase protein I